MVAFSLRVLAVVAAAAVATADPKPPAVTFLYTANLTIPASVNVGSVPTGSRGVLSIAGGTFAGPKLSGKHNIDVWSFRFPVDRTVF